MVIKVAFLISLTVALLSCGLASAVDQDYGSTVQAGDGLYTYDENNPPEVFFFPKDKAKWDGSKVTMSEWYMLTELQKEKFLSEYFQELNAKFNIDIDAIGAEYLNALNAFSAY